MLKAIFAAAGILVASQANASFYDLCEFQAEVVKVSQVDLLNGTVTNDESRLAAIVRILSAEDLGGHTDCSGYVGQLNILKLSDSDFARISEGATIKLHFDTLNGLTPDGVFERTTWTLIDDDSHDDFFEAGVQVMAARFDDATSEIVLTVAVGGGCGEHRYALEVGLCRETFPVQCDVVVKHTTNDLCRAFLTEEVRIKLADAGLDDSYFTGAYLTIQGDNDTEASLQLPFNR